MRWWCWLLATTALACGGSGRTFASNPGGASNEGPSSESGASSGGGPQSGPDTSEGLGGAAGATESPRTSGGDLSYGGQPPEETCIGCVIDGACVPDGTVAPDEPCRVCRPQRARDAYSANVGAECGSEATTCSAQDTCNALGVCEPNHEDDGTLCGGDSGICQDGTCRPRPPNPFDCIAPTPPVTELTAATYSLTSTPPTPKGGTIVDGRYVPARFDIYSSNVAGIDVRTFELSGGYVQAASQYFSLETMGAYIPAVRFAGSFSTSGTSLVFDVQRCDPEYDIALPNITYTATANSLVTSTPLPDGGTLVTSYMRQ